MTARGGASVSTLNGAQTTALVGVLGAVAGGTMTEGQAAMVISTSIGVDTEQALHIIRGEA